MSEGKTVKVENKLKNSEISKYKAEELIFALDIGTRTVVGLVGVQEGDKLKILAVEINEHKNRAMLDGQIHDISLVADIVADVKGKLENKLGIKLKKVAIAAAGRVLKTYSVKVERTFEASKEITKDIISSIELEGVQNAQAELESEQKDNEKTVFYCVGYSVISYYLNGYVISSLLGHKGKTAGVEVLATFLPHVVIDSLYTVMNRVGLQVTNLTLEPIAAINVCIPPNLRLLNLALVDIGAGTSDIAITKDGAVIGYSMAPIAGDEITEKIAHQYLVDFNTAEKIKLTLNDNSEPNVSFTDVLGSARVVDKKEIRTAIYESVVLLGETIADRIMEYNKKAPNAIFCVGGGSQIGGLTEAIADKLGLTHDRVVVRGRDFIQSVKFSGKKLAGPEAITPLGIAVNAMQSMESDFLSVTLNEKKIRLFNSKKLSVADALILDGFDPKYLIGRTGRSISYQINGEKKIIRGEHGKAAEIKVNGQPASMETALKPGDNIQITPAVDGVSAKLSLSDLVDIGEKRITYNNLKVDITPAVTINYKAVTENTAIKDGDKIDINVIKTIQDFADSVGIDINDGVSTVNGVEVGKNYVLKDSDVIEFNDYKVKSKKNNKPSEALYSNTTVQNKIVNDERINYVDNLNHTNTNSEVKTNMSSSNEDMSKSIRNSVSVLVNGKKLTLDGSKNEYFFVDIFNTYQVDTKQLRAGTVQLKLNGRPAAYTDKIKNGDNIEVIWENN
ncbi:MAG: cell division FtsA domain-containing protein [Deltaproteobacteria bacterium]